MKQLPNSLCIFLSCVIHLAAVPQAVSSEGRASAVPAAPRNGDELSKRVEELRGLARPWLRSLPGPLDDHSRVRLSGDGWLRKVEFHGQAAPIASEAAAWQSPTLNEADWEHATVPEWNYAASKHGSPFSDIIWYRKHFSSPPETGSNRIWLAFDGVDWDAEVFLNGKRVASHQIYFEPFRAEITGMLAAENVLAVRVKSGMVFDEPAAFWSVYPVAATRNNAPGRYTDNYAVTTTNMRNGDTHAGDGCGIHRDVWLEQSGPIRISRIFARAADDRKEVRVKLEVDAADAGMADIQARLLPDNFDGGTVFEEKLEQRLEKGPNLIEFTVPTIGLHPWSPEEPRLYRCRVTLSPRTGNPETRDTLLGARTFALVGDANAKTAPGQPEGMFLLNSRPIFLRGANIQGLNALWLWGEHDKLLKVLLHLKAANFNAVRSCQHVCFPEVLELMDRLGILSEQDVGCRGLVTPGVAAQLELAAAALARMTYQNPGVVLLSLANETKFDPSVMLRAALAADPARVFVPISGHPHGGAVYPNADRSGYQLDADLWAQVIDDVHPYWGWYGFVGQLPKFCQVMAPGRMVTVGEYGSEALDGYDTMARYPTGWKPRPPQEADVLWGQVQVKKNDVRQRQGLRGQTPANLGDYITASQNYQYDQLAEVTKSWRLSARRVGGYFQFHFVDVLPANWPKSILSHDLTPKRGFFAMAQVNQPLVPLPVVLAGAASMELWVANDRPKAFPGAKLHWAVHAPGPPSDEVLASGEIPVDVPASNALRAGVASLSTIPKETTVVNLSLTLHGSNGDTLASYVQEIYLDAWR